MAGAPRGDCATFLIWQMACAYATFLIWQAARAYATFLIWQARLCDDARARHSVKDV